MQEKKQGSGNKCNICKGKGHNKKKLAEKHFQMKMQEKSNKPKVFKGFKVKVFQMQGFKVKVFQIMLDSCILPNKQLHKTLTIHVSIIIMMWF